MWLIDGGRRLDAAKLAFHETIPAIVVRTLDDLCEVLYRDKGQWDQGDPTRRTMLLSDNVQLGLIIQKVQQYIRMINRNHVGTPLPNKVKMDDFYAYLDMKPYEWHRLRVLACIWVPKAGADVKLAQEIMNLVDQGEIPITAAYSRYTNQTPPPEVLLGSAIPTKMWREKIASLTNSLALITEQLESLKIVPSDIQADEIQPWIEEIIQIRRTMVRVENTLGSTYNHRKGVTP